jgi:hypothetical protein
MSVKYVPDLCPCTPEGKKESEEIGKEKERVERWQKFFFN